MLQRIGLGYLLAALAILFLPLPGQVVVGGLLLAGYAWALLHVSVPGFGTGVITPPGNVAGWVDRSIFGQAHLYRHQPYDPEGVGSTPAAVVTILLGAWCGEWLRRRPRTSATSLGVAIGAVVAAAAGWWWSQSLPLNKRIWSPSYVLWTAGLIGLGLSVVWELVEVRGLRRLRHPWAILGSNALVLYLVTELGDRVLGLVHVGNSTAHMWSYRHGFASWLPSTAASVAWTLSFVAVWGLVSAALFRKGILIRV